jgi:hypothetical protein
MADTKYQDGVYRKQESDELVVANGGTITVESGGAVTFETGGEFDVESGGSIDIQSGGELTVESGGKITGDSGGIFKFYDTEYTSDLIRNMIKSLTSFTDYYRSGAVSFFNVSQLATNYGYHMWSGDTTMSLGSVTLPVPDSGCILWLNADRLAGDGNLSVLISTGTSMMNQGSVLISAFELSTLGYAKLICVHAGQWAVVEANYTEHTEA